MGCDMTRHEIMRFACFPLYGAAYYLEYTPTDRLDEDIRMMKEAGLTVVRVGDGIIVRNFIKDIR